VAMQPRMCTSEYRELVIHEILRRTAERFPHRTALCFGNRSLMFAELEQKSNRLANALSAIGLRSGERLALYLWNGPEYELAFYAASKLGAVVCPVNPSYRERETAHQLLDSGSSVLIMHFTLLPVVEAIRDQLPALRNIVVVGQSEPAANSLRYFDELLLETSSQSPQFQVMPGELAALPYSSGTTGLSKGVMLTHRNLVSNHIQFGTAAEISSSDAVLVCLPLSHIYGITLMGTAVWSGAKQVLLQRFEMKAALTLIENHGITILHVVPPILLALANDPELRPSQTRTLRYIVSAAAPMAPDIARRVEDRLGIAVLQAYGMSEASGTHHSPIPPRRVKLESCGLPLCRTEHAVVDVETGHHHLRPGQIGEIIIRGPQVMSGYWSAPQESARVLRDGWLHTGDIGFVDDEGYLFLVDRAKDLIKCRGFSVSPAELESLLLEHPAILDCAVVGVRLSDLEETPKAFVVPRSRGSIDLPSLEAFVAGRLAGYKSIRRWEIVEAIPRSPTGKILRRVLKERDLL